MDRKATARVLTAALTAGVAAMTLSAPSEAAPTVDRPAGPATTTSDAGSAQMVGALERDLRLSPRQALERLAKAESAGRIEPAVRARLGGSFAGAWLSAEDQRLVVATTDPGKADLVRTLGAEPRVVARTQRQLDAVVARLDAVKAPATVHMWHVDVESNSVVVHADPAAPAATTKFLRTSGADPAAVRVVPSTDRPVPYHDLRGGNMYDGNFLPLPPYGTCSIGFSVRQKPTHVTPGFVTAGHCLHVGQQPYGDTGDGLASLGTTRGSVYPGNDRAWVEVNSNWTTRAWVNRYSGNQTYLVHGSAVAPIGAPVCRSGYATGFKCGVIQARNVTVNYGDGPVNGLTQTSACAGHGDSGGPFIATQTNGIQAQGVLSGGTGNCTSGGMTVFEPLQPMLDGFNLALVVTTLPMIINLICEYHGNFKFSCLLAYASSLPAQIEWTVGGTRMPSWDGDTDVSGGCGTGTLGIGVKVITSAGTVTRSTSVRCEGIPPIAVR